MDKLLALDERRRQLLPEIEGARSERKQEAGKIGALKKAGEDATAQMEAVRQLRGTSTAQVPDVNVSMVISGPMVTPVSSMILGSGETL